MAQCRQCKVRKINKQNRKSAYLPSLEVKIHSPDIFQPKVQSLISILEEEREKKERYLLKDLEDFYNNELNDASKRIINVIKTSLKIFDDDNLYKSILDMSMNRPIILFDSHSQNIIQNENHKNSQSSQKKPAILIQNYIADTKPKEDNNDCSGNKKQNPDDMTSNYIKSVSNAITNQIVNNFNKIEQQGSSFKQYDNINNNNKNIKNGPISTNNIKRLIRQLENKKNNENTKKKTNLKRTNNKNKPIFTSFIQSNMQTNINEVYTKPISVEMKLPSDPDPKIKSEIEKIENERAKYEDKLFEQAKEEMKLLTEITISELQQNLKEELYPYFAVGGNTIKSIKSVVDKSIRQPMKLLNFKQINNKKFSSFIESKTNTKKKRRR